MKISEVVLEISTLWEGSCEEVSKHMTKISDSEGYKSLKSSDKDSKLNTASFLPNIVEWVRFLETNDVIRKISGFYRGILEKQPDDKPKHQSSLSLLYNFKELLMSFTQLDEDATILISQKNIRVLSLNPYRPFKEIIQKARDVIFASGTLKPLDDFYSLQATSSSTPNPQTPPKTQKSINDQILHKSPQNLKNSIKENSFDKNPKLDVCNENSSLKVASEVNHFSCGHIIAPEQLECVSVREYTDGSGRRQKFNFQYANRKNCEQVKALGRYLVQMAKQRIDMR